jgi:CheY-like chemotaxis protein
MFSILLVDDSLTDRRLIEGLLNKRLHFSVDTAEDGSHALKKMKAKVPDIVVTDMQMPNMDGLQLVEQIRSLYPLVPVILITSEGSEDLAARALQRGAAGYVPKSRCEELLRDTIENVMELTRSESSFERIIDCAEVSFFQFSFENDFAMIAPLFELAQRMTVSMGVCDETAGVQVGVALEHAIMNAIYHGNLEIEGAANGDRTVMNERLSQSPYKDRKVHVEIRITREEAKFLVRDDGPGFNVKEVAATGQKKALNGESGRGLLLMWAFMDSVNFDSKGSTVVMVKRRVEPALPPPVEKTEAEPETKKFVLPEVLGKLIPSDGAVPLSLNKTRMTAGRDPSCDIVIRSSSISQHHCLLYIFQGWWYVRDMKSKNGIRVNHVPYAEHLLRPGSILSIGKYEYKIEYEPYLLGADGIDPPADPFSS